MVVKRLSQTSYLPVFFRGKLGSVTVKETAGEDCNMTQTHLLVVLPSMLWPVTPGSTPEPKSWRKDPGGGPGTLAGAEPG